MQDIQRSKNANPAKLNSPVPSPFSRENEKCQILAKKGFLTAKNLTSGVAILVYSEEFQLGVLLHLNSYSDSGDSRISFDGDPFAKSAIAMILEEFESLGVRKKDLVTYAIGGSADKGIPQVTDAAMRSALWSKGLVPSACDLGGSQVRSIWMDVETGRIIVRSEPIILNALDARVSIPVAS